MRYERRNIVRLINLGGGWSNSKQMGVKTIFEHTIILKIIKGGNSQVILSNVHRATSVFIFMA